MREDIPTIIWCYFAPSYITQLVKVLLKYNRIKYQQRKSSNKQYVEIKINRTRGLYINTKRY